MLTFGSLFAGIGGFDLGFERAGMCCLWQCEIDSYCERVLEKHWPDVLRVRDIRGVSAENVPAVDVLCGGFPCQDISLAGNGSGIDGPHSGLWSEYARLIGELRPRYVVVENVAALLVRGMGRVLGDLAALGYDAEWDCIPASAVGAPHRRDRLWIVAYPHGDDGGSGREGRPAPSGARQPKPKRSLQMADASWDATAGSTAQAGAERERVGPSSKRSGTPVADADLSRRDGRAGPTDGEWFAEPDVGRVADGIPARVDRLRSLGNALVPQIAQWIGERLVSYEEAILDEEGC
jgi:DNA (cytosine-5)-methyltransferase 1